MNLQTYVLSKMCHSKEAAIHGITHLKANDFEGNGKVIYTVVKSIYKQHNTVDLHVFVSQCSAQGIKESFANDVFQYALGQTDEWKNVFNEFKDKSTKRNIRNDLQDILTSIDTNEISSLVSQTTKSATDWASDTDKRYYTGKEVDESPVDEGMPILTGYQLYDNHIYKNGGNQKGQMKGVICREKHGKTRSECWEVAQNLRQGHKVLYITMEGRKSDITGNIKQVLKDEWDGVRENVFIVDGIVHIDEIESVILEAVLIENVDKVVVDYIQLVVADGNSENEIINKSTERLRHSMVKYNYHLVLLCQATKISSYTKNKSDVPTGWTYVPTANDAYGSMALIKASSLILVGYRPNIYEENIIHSDLGDAVIDIFGDKVSYHSFFMKTIRSRNKPEYLHTWYKFQDTDEGLKNLAWA